MTEPGRQLYETYAGHFKHRHPLPWRALHILERALWANTERDARSPQEAQSAALHA